jgi:hypothetical protein
MVFHFSKQVLWNATGVVSILNSTGSVVGMLNKTTSPEAFLNDVTNGTRLVIGASGVLKKGESFTVSVPAGLVRDLHGVPTASTVSKKFTCLAEVADVESPVLGASSPYQSQTAVFGSTSEMSLFFSKAIQHGTTNNILIKRGTGDAAVISSDNGTAVTVSGSKLTVTFPPFLTAGLYGIEIPAGTFKDSLGNSFAGINTSQLTFNVNDKDSSPPTLSGSEPSSEGSTATYTHPTSATLLLSFNENVQLGVGSISFVPRHLAGTTVVDVTSSMVAISDSQMAVAPPELLPGEVYDVIIDKGIVLDLEGNEYAGLTAGNYRFSTAPLIRFTLVGDSFWSDSNVGYFDGTRYSPQVIIDTSNIVYVVGGYNGTTGHSHDSALNDVWKFVTMRMTNCHSHHEPRSACSQSFCNSASKKGTWSSSSKV